MCRIYMLGITICQQCCESQQTDGFTTEVKVKVSGGYEIVFIVNVEEMEGSHHLKQLRLHMKCVIRVYHQMISNFPWHFQAFPSGLE